MLENRWAMLALIFITRTSMGFTFQSVASVAPLLIDEFTLSFGQIGWLMGLFLLPGVVLALPGGMLGRRFESHHVATAGLGLMLAGALVTAWSQGFATACIGRTVSGAGGILLNLFLVKMVADWFTGREISTALGIMLTSWPVGIGLALATLGRVAAHASWRASILTTAAVAACALVLIAALYRKPSGLAVDAKRVALQLDLPRRAWTLSIAAGLCWTALNASFIVLASFGPTFLTARGASVAEAGSLVSLGIWASLVSVPVGGYAADRARRPDLLISVGALTTALCMALVPIAGPPVVWFVLAGTVLGLAPAAIMALLPQVLAPAHLATGLGVLYTIFYLGMALAQPAAGWTRDVSGSPAMPVYFGAALMAATVVALGAFRWIERRGNGHARRAST